MKKGKSHLTCWLTVVCSVFLTSSAMAQRPAVPSVQELNKPFGAYDTEAFKAPPKVCYPETWFHYIGGNVSLEGITADLEAIAQAGLSGVQLFHGQFGGLWPEVSNPIACLSPMWDNAVEHTARECQRLGLRFTMQNCPGWAMSGGPWITPSNAMRHLVYSRTDIMGSDINKGKELPVSQANKEDWRDYRDIVVLAFPTPEGDTGEPLKPSSVKSNQEGEWADCLSGNLKEPFRFKPAEKDNPHWVEVSFSEPVLLRTVEFPSINSMSHGWCYEPGVAITVQAILPNGETKDILQADMPQASWQDDQPISFACPEIAGVSTYRISFTNRHDMALQSLRLFSAARQNNWEAEAGWTLRSIERAGENAEQSALAHLPFDKIIDISDKMDANGRLNWNAPTKGKWTVLRIGHVNTGMRNSPAPPEGTGWECDKLSTAGPDAHFAGYIGRLNKEALKGGLLNGMLLDSWECKTQTWTTAMEKEFAQRTDYPLRKWLPAVFGYVVDDSETTKRFLRDWRGVIGDLFANNFYGRMAELSKENGLTITYETAAGDIFPADILEYYKHADIPMCEFWQPFSEGYVGSLNFKPIKPTTSAARIYGKPRVAAEAFTSFSLTWDEHLEMLKEAANVNCIEGVTHLVFHTYTHNPQIGFLPPGTSMGSAIGTPFLRGQTWWKYMPEFTSYLARCTYMLERGKPVSDILWYLGDEMNHKPDQHYPFPEGFKYDYCNPDVLLNRLSVKDGMLATPEGIRYKALWMPDCLRMLPETLEKLYALISDGATVIGDAPEGIATLAGGEKGQKRFDAAVQHIWGKPSSNQGVRTLGKGRIVSDMSLEQAIKMLNLEPDVTGGSALWLHRKIEGADWYYVTAPIGTGFDGTLHFRAKGKVELWDPLTGDIQQIAGRYANNRTSVALNLPPSGACFVVFKPNDEPESEGRKTTVGPDMTYIPLNNDWTLTFPAGWGAPPSLNLKQLQAWKDLPIAPEGKAFSGTATYTTTFEATELDAGTRLHLDLGRVDMIAAVKLNGKQLRTLWTPPYSLDITDALQTGENTLTIEVTGTWYNRLAYDAGQPEANRKTWTINGPSKDASLRESGLFGPVRLCVEEYGMEE